LIMLPRGNHATTENVQGQVVGTDPDTDIAVVKIEPRIAHGVPR